MPRYGIEFEFFVDAPDAQTAYHMIDSLLTKLPRGGEADLSYESCPRSEYPYATNDDTGDEEEIEL